MFWVTFSIITLFVIGAGLALYEWRKKTTVLRHDLRQAPPASAELAAERDRASHRPGAHGGMNEPHMMG
ncbi:MAG: hypothetical protein GVY31_13710 [Alphaproteobacteria bacterium]|nr:hypothetical protein [Alphaproteobacteria bacterium]